MLFIHVFSNADTLRSYGKYTIFVRFLKISYFIMRRLVDYIKDWMLPIAIITGISAFLVYYFTPSLAPFGPLFHRIAADGQRILIGVLLFFQFVKASPHDMGLRRWHLYVLLFQCLTFVGLAVLAAFMDRNGLRIMVECAMLCLMCPTASAAGVITDKLGGRIAETVTYLVIVNTVATLVIPTVIPLVHPSSDMGFWRYVLAIAWKIFPLLICPCILAWIIRYTMPKLQRALMRFSPKSFYIWGVCLALAMVLSTRALITSFPGVWTLWGIVAVTVLCCAIQFKLGRVFGRAAEKAVASGEPEEASSLEGVSPTAITAGQALGQKNTGFLIWLGYTYMTPVTSIAGGLYAIFQNIFNSWELYQKKSSKNQ